MVALADADPGEVIGDEPARPLPLDEAAFRKEKLPTIDLPVDRLVELAELLAGCRLDGKGGWSLLELEELNARWE